ncbi:MAG: phosphoribosylamine--glycine ligase [Gammaproteobacteria bacterium]|nr:phosphoribosylamine--glycine ligase [Gammaproteobacteria bacterium]MBT7322514.1 phosphoribosylamine--glycine ligase [Gammaproteobacteria bacterium]
MKQNILVIGQGGREHAIAWKISKSPKVQKVFVCPGNAGTALEKDIENIDINISDINSLINFVKTNNVILTIVGPEVPLVEGIVNKFFEHNLKIFGPTKEHSLLEGSKVFSKEFMINYDIPTAEYQMFSNQDQAKAYVANKKHPIVIKADGLAAGKGVIVSSSVEESISAIDKLLNPDYSEFIVIEEFLSGQELSAIYICNYKGCSFEIGLPWTKDYKSRDEYNSGPNTGGMGAVSHPLSYEHKNEVYKLYLDIEKILVKTINGINDYNKKTNVKYLGFLYIGLMVDSTNKVKVLEYNCRMGDPETQNLMLSLENQNFDFLEMIFNDPTIKIQDLNIENFNHNNRGYCCTIVLAAKGYPEEYKKGFYIDTNNVEESKTVKLFHAGTVLDDNRICATGGRILTINVYAENQKEAVNLAYKNIKKIKIFEDKDMKIENNNLVFFREDIGN